MSAPNDLDCRIYVEGQQDALVALLLRLCVEASWDPRARTVRTKHGDIEVRKNDETDPSRALAFPDGFLYFRCVLEFYPNPHVPHEDRVRFLSSLLSEIWGEKLPAAAACDYENELPHRGGFKDKALPWPSLSVNGAPDKRRSSADIVS
jgi:hypothetical protein